MKEFVHLLHLLLITPLHILPWWACILEVFWLICGPFIMWWSYPYTFGTLALLEMSAIQYWFGRLVAAISPYPFLMLINYFAIAIFFRDAHV